MEKGNLKSAEEFIEFLQERKIYRKFKECLEKNETGLETDINLFLHNQTEMELMADPFQGFLWADTEEGFQFWNNYDTEWSNIYYKEN